MPASSLVTTRVGIATKTSHCLDESTLHVPRYEKSLQ